jgi:hypothetical protein
MNPIFEEGKEGEEIEQVNLMIEERDLNKLDKEDESDINYEEIDEDETDLDTNDGTNTDEFGSQSQGDKKRNKLAANRNFSNELNDRTKAAIFLFCFLSFAMK